MKVDIALLLTVLLGFSSAIAQTEQKQANATIRTLVHQGDKAEKVKSTDFVQVQTADGWQNAEQGMAIVEGQSIKTEQSGNFALEYDKDYSNAHIFVGENTQVKTEVNPGEGRWRTILLEVGEIYVKVKGFFAAKSRLFNSVVGMTEFYMRIDASGQEGFVYVVKGKVTVINEQGRLALYAGQAARITLSLAPVLTAPSAAHVQHITTWAQQMQKLSNPWWQFYKSPWFYVPAGVVGGYTFYKVIIDRPDSHNPLPGPPDPPQRSE
ncbi:hypothetical protein EH223_00115 [candidate division KSB1 bacterium]|nr:hypothetical protein [candidate division KSB1 bacterium]RQW07329.1 MAG: hypothetical protein EH223_00115 [candidate division KSB1 bacterium]